MGDSISNFLVRQNFASARWVLSLGAFLAWLCVAQAGTGHQGDSAEDPAGSQLSAGPAGPSASDAALETHVCSSSYAPALRNFFYREFRDWAASKKSRGEAITTADIAKFSLLLYTADYQSNGVPTLMTNGSGSEKGGFAQSRQDYREGRNYKADVFATFSKRVGSFKFEEDSSFGIFKIPQFILSRGTKTLKTIRAELKSQPEKIVERCNTSALYSTEQMKGVIEALKQGGDSSLMNCNLSDSRCLALWSAVCPRMNMAIFVEGSIPIKYFSKDIQSKEAQFNAEVKKAPCSNVFTSIAGEVVGEKSDRSSTRQTAPAPRLRPLLGSRVPTYEYPPGQGPQKSHVEKPRSDPRVKFAPAPEAPVDNRGFFRRLFGMKPKASSSHLAQGSALPPESRAPAASTLRLPPPPPAPFQQKPKSDHADAGEDDPAAYTAPARPSAQMDSRYDPRPGEVAPEVRALRMSRQLPTLDIAMADLPKQFSSEAAKAKYLSFLNAPSEVDRSNWKTKDFAPALVANLEYIHQNGARIVGAKGWDTRIGSCYKYVKWALKRSGVVKDYLPGVPAIAAHEEGILKNAGFTDLKARGYTVATAPVGSIIVYYGGKNQKIREGATQKDGDIAIKTDYGVVSDYSKSGDGLSWPVAAIYARI